MLSFQRGASARAIVLMESVRLPVEQAAGMCDGRDKLVERLIDGNSGRLRAFRALGDVFARGVDVDARDAPRAAQHRRGHRSGARKRVDVAPESLVGRGSLDDSVKDIRARVFQIATEPLDRSRQSLDIVPVDVVLALVEEAVQGSVCPSAHGELVLCLAHRVHGLSRNAKQEEEDFG